MSNTKLIGIIVYASVLVLIFLFPPVDYHSYMSGPRVSFYGWMIISDVGGGTPNHNYEINITYLLVEIIIVTLIYGFYLYLTKNDK